MRIIPIADIFQFTAGEIIPSVQGKVVKLKGRSKGTNNDGEWSIERIELQDASASIMVMIRDRAPLDQGLLNQHITISCKNGEKGLTGIKAKDDTYRDKTSRVISVTPTGIIEPSQPGQATAPTPAPQQQQQATAPAQSTQPPPAASQPPSSAPQTQQPKTHTNGNGNGNGEPKPDEPAVKRRLNKMANLYLHCLSAADYVNSERQKLKGGENALTQAEVKGLATSFFIESCKMQNGLWHITPHGAFSGNKE